MYWCLLLHWPVPIFNARVPSILLSNLIPFFCLLSFSLYHITSLLTRRISEQSVKYNDLSWGCMRVQVNYLEIQSGWPEQLIHRQVTRWPKGGSSFQETKWAVQVVYVLDQKAENYCGIWCPHSYHIRRWSSSPAFESGHHFQSRQVVMSFPGRHSRASFPPKNICVKRGHTTFTTSLLSTFHRGRTRQRMV